MGPKMRAAIDTMKCGRVFTTSELKELGIDRKVIRRLRDAECIHSVSQGRYCISDEYLVEPLEMNEKSFMLEDFSVALTHGGPDSFICLYPAAYWHDLGVDNNFQTITAGIPRSRGTPAAHGDQYQFIRWRQEDALKVGVVNAGSFRGEDIRITDKERTVVDLIRYSTLNSVQETSNLLIDEESAIEAVNRYIGSDGYRPAKLSEMAHTFGVGTQVDLFIKKASRDIEYEGPSSGMSM